MPALDLRILLLIPLGLAEAFLLWLLWHLILDQWPMRRVRVPAPGRRPGFVHDARIQLIR